jgi:hypothetical protein
MADSLFLNRLNPARPRRPEPRRSKEARIKKF